MRLALALFVQAFGVICAAIGLLHIGFGPAVIPDSVPVNATMDSEDRFYATLFVGFGIAMRWCGLDLAARDRIFFFLLAVFFASGLARIVSAVAVGLPHPLFQFLGALELVLPPLLWLAHRRLFGGDAARGNDTADALR